MKNPLKIYEDKQIVVYSKKDMYIGEEPEIADALLECALIGYMQFAQHMKYKKDKKEFIQSVYLAAQDRFEDVMDEVVGKI